MEKGIPEVYEIRWNNKKVKSFYHARMGSLLAFTWKARSIGR